MSLRCPHCSSVIDEVEAASGSVICPGCGQEVSSTSVFQRQEETRYDEPVVAAPTRTFEKQSVGATVIPPPAPASVHIAPALPPAPFVPPPTLGRYRLLEELGTGAFGRVYRALDTELQRYVAIKILKAERFTDQQDLDKFFDEARLMASVHHPGIVAVHDVGSDHGVKYIVTQLIKGGTLHDRLTRGPMSHREAADLIRQCAAAIHAAHKVQLYHRDLKPKNILLDEQGRAYVSDFGLAIRRQDQTDRIGEFAGSVNFMSPEQLRGEVHHIDGRSDVWALGVIFYLLLTGKLPFQGPASKLITEIQIRNPLPPRQLQETIPPELERICLKCLEKQLDCRYCSAFELASELGDWMALSESPLLSASSSLIVTEPDPQTELVESAKSPKLQPIAFRSNWKFFVGCAVLVLTVLVWFRLDELMSLTSTHSNNGSRNKPILLNDPFQIDTYAVPGRPYSILERAPRETIWPRKTAITTARYFFDESRQELMADVPELGLLGLGKTQSENFRVRVSIAKNKWEGSTGIFWGFAASTDGGVDQQCNCVLIKGFRNSKGLMVLEAKLKRFEFRKAESFAIPLVDQHEISSASVTVEGAGPFDLDLTIHGGVPASIKWCGSELSRLIIPTHNPSAPILPSRGVFGVAVMTSSAVFSDARVTFFDAVSADQSRK